MHVWILVHKQWTTKTKFDWISHNCAVTFKSWRLDDDKNYHMRANPMDKTIVGSVNPISDRADSNEAEIIDLSRDDVNDFKRSQALKSSVGGFEMTRNAKSAEQATESLARYPENTTSMPECAAMPETDEIERTFDGLIASVYAQLANMSPYIDSASPDSNQVPKLSTNIRIKMDIKYWKDLGTRLIVKNSTLNASVTHV